MRNKSLKSAAIFALLAPIIFHGCQKEVDNLIIDTPSEFPVPRIINIGVVDVQGNELTDYQLSIDGPKDFSGNQSASVFSLKDVADGVYTVEVSKPGYSSARRIVEFKGNEKLSIGTTQNVQLKLAKLNEGQRIDHEKGGQIMVPNHLGLSGDITVNIPPSAIAGPGGTDISITQAQIDFGSRNWDVTRPSGAFSLICEPSGIVFDAPIQVRIPLSPNGLTPEDIGGMQLLIEDPETGRLIPSEDPDDMLVATLISGEDAVLVEIPHFSAWISFPPQPNRWYRWLGDDPLDPAIPEDTITWSAWSLVDSSATAGAPIMGTYSVNDVFTPTSNDEIDYCNHANATLAPQDCDITISYTYNNTPPPGQYAWIFLRYRILDVDLAQGNRGNIVSEFSQPIASGGGVWEVSIQYTETSQRPSPPAS